MTWFLFTIISPILNALVNYIDKYLIEKVVEGRGIGSLIIFSALMGLPVALLIMLFGPNVFGIHPKNALLIMLNGTFYVAWVLPYLYALEKDEASVVMPLFQISSVLVYVFSHIFLGETLYIRQFIGCLLILVGAVGITLERKVTESGKRELKVKSVVLALVSLSCFFIAVSGVIFKSVALEESFWVTSFWENVGIFLSALPLLRVSSYRGQFLAVLKVNKFKILTLNALNESLVSVGRISLNYATLLVPIALVFFVDTGFQPFFVLIFGILLSIFFPKFTNEDIRYSKIIQKLFAVSIMFAGTYFISF